MRGRRRRGYHGDRFPLFLLAFGLGLIVALLCSPRLVLLVAAAALIYVGICGNCR